MAFIPSVSVLETPLDGNSVKIQDTTGNVGVGGNTTGYGQTTPVHATPIIYGVVGKLLTALTWTYFGFVKASVATAIQTTGYYLTATLFNMTKFLDGVNVFNLVAYQSLGAFTIDATGKIVTLTSNTLVQSYMTNGYTWATAVVTASGNGVSNVEIDVAATVADNQNNRITLKTALGAAAAGHTFNIGLPAMFYFLEMYAGNKCLVEGIGKDLVDNSCLDKNSLVAHYTELAMMQLAGKIAFSCKDYADAHNAISTLNLKCGAGCSGC